MIQIITEVIFSTDGNSGSPEIYYSILQNIERSDVFIGDVSIIGEITNKKVKKMCKSKCNT